MTLKLTKTENTSENILSPQTEQSKKQIGYIARSEATTKTYTDLGFKCGLEIHQQLKTKRKLFCRCPLVFTRNRMIMMRK